MPERLASNGGILSVFRQVDAEPVTGPEVPGMYFLYYLKNVGFRVKGFGQDAVDLTTLIGSGVKLRFSFPGVLNITENPYLPIEPLDHSVSITKLRAFVKTPSVGASIIVTFKKMTLLTGVLSASIGTVTILAGAYLGATDLVTPVAIDYTTEALVMEITQVGVSTTEGSNLTGWATGV